jgi:nucleoside-diphosphate-sugar epimerase
MSDTGPIVVTGASGFVGNALVRRLLAEGREVHVLLRASAKTWRMRDLAGRVTVHSADLLDAPAVADALRKAKPAVVMHLAAYGAYESQAEPRRILETNILGTLALLEAARAAGVGLFVNAGSSSEYGYKSEPMRETDRLEPNSVYAVGKAAAAHLVALPAMRGDMAAVTMRLFSVYGPWEEPTRLIPTVIRKARAGLPLEMVPPETARDFVFVDDVLDAMTAFDRLSACRGEVLNIGSGVQSTMREVVEAVQRAVGTRSEIRWGAFPARKWDTARWQADPSRAAEVLGWRARTPLADGMARMAAWMAEVGDGYGGQ